VALVGYGLAGRVFHAPLIAHTTGISLRAVVTGNPARQQQAATECPDARVIGSVDALWDAADDFDVAVVATPTARHLPHAVGAVRAGLHVVVDKPVAGTAADAEMLAVEAARHGRQVHVFHNRRWDSDFLGIRDLVASGALGTPLVLESRMASLRPVHSGSWRNSPDPGDFGGLLLDMGSHLVDQALQLMGPVESVSAATQSLREGAGADDFCSLQLVHEGGSTSLLVASKAMPFTEARFTVMGTRAAARVQWTDSQEQALRNGMSPVGPGWGEEPSSSAVEVCALDGSDGTAPRLVRPPHGAWNTFYAKVLAAISEGGHHPVPLRDAIDTMRVLDAARTAAAGRSTVALVPPARHGLQQGA
jgi:predicted dehydrogenase